MGYLRYIYGISKVNLHYHGNVMKTKKQSMVILNVLIKWFLAGQIIQKVLKHHSKSH